MAAAAAVVGFLGCGCPDEVRQEARVVIKGSVADVAKPRSMPDGAPRASDVLMRSLRLRPRNAKDPHDTMRALRDFHVSRLEWAYITDKEFIAKVKASGRVFGGAASAPSYVKPPDDPDWFQKVVIVNLDGEPIIAPWKRAWNRTLWGCINNPELERGYIEYLKRYLDAGAQVMQRDEPGANANATRWGGCFCPHCMAAFRTYLADHTTAEQRAKLGIADVATFDYREHLKKQGAPVGDPFGRWNGGELKKLFVEFQTEATIAFHQRTRKALDAHAGHRVPMSCNNGCRRWSAIEMEFDWAFGELSYRHATPVYIHDALREADRHGRRQVVTMPKKSNADNPEEWEHRTRCTIAMAYACGGHCMAPWDVYMPGNAPRYFGTPEQYADLFAFIRANARTLDAYEHAGAFGKGIRCDLYGSDPPIRVRAETVVYAVVRARPGEPDAPVVVHLVDWSPEPKPFTVHLNPARLFGDRGLTCRLLVPAPYDRRAHEQAEQTRSCGKLSMAIALESGYATTLRLPALAPWGLLVIEPDASRADGVWQPTISADAADYYRPTLKVKMASASTNAAIRYTTDGAEPTAASPQYTAPLTLTEDTTLKARAFRADGAASAVAAATFTKAKDNPTPLPPDSVPLKPALRLWLKADALTLADGEPVATWRASAGPDAVASPLKQRSGKTAAPPTFRANALAGKPVVSFDGDDDALVVEGFTNQHLAGKAFTILLVTRSADRAFGICGNSASGLGGAPRLYLTRGGFNYHVLTPRLGLRPPGDLPAITTFGHDGKGTIAAYTNGKLEGRVADLPLAEKFGGGNLAMPFWAGNRNHAGDIAEIVVFDRQLTDAERQAVEACLADKYAIPCWRRWR